MLQTAIPYAAHATLKVGGVACDPPYFPWLDTPFSGVLMPQTMTPLDAEKGAVATWLDTPF